MSNFNFELEYFDDEEFQAADTAVFNKKGMHLTDIQKTAHTGAWQGYTYEITVQKGYSNKYLKQHVKPNSWKILPELLGKQVSRKNFRAALQRRLKESETTD